MNEREAILRRWREAEAAGEPAVLATVVAVRGSTVRATGARLLVAEDGEQVGFLSAGCLEADLTVRARRVLDRGEPEVARYDAEESADLVFGLGMGCGGDSVVLLEPLPGPGGEVLERIVAAGSARRRAVLATVHDGPEASATPAGRRLLLVEGDEPWTDLAEGDLRERIEERAGELLCGKTSTEEEIEGARVGFEVVIPPVHVIVVGAGPVAAELLQTSHQLGWRVSVADPREASLRVPALEAAEALFTDPLEALDGPPGLDRRTAVVILAHKPALEADVLQRAAGQDAGYLGVLGSRRRRGALMDELASRGVPEEIREGISMPVGLEVGAEAAAEIALSIAAEIQARMAAESQARGRRAE